MKVIRIAQVPPRTIPATATVKEAIPALGAEAGCAVAVVDGQKLAGTLSKDDIMYRVVGAGRDPETTSVREVMTAPPFTVKPDVDAEEAMKLMFHLRQCYLPITDSQGELKGWLALCDLFKDHVEDLVRQLDSMAAYMGADGPGGD